MLARAGLDLHRAVLANWVGKAAFHLKPVVDRLAEHLKRSSKLFMDETTALVLDPGRGVTKTGYLWAMARDDRPWGGDDPPRVVYFYAPGRAGENAETFLAGFDGILQVDGYIGNNRLTKASRKGGRPFGWHIAGRMRVANSRTFRPRRLRDRRRRPAPHRRVLHHRSRHQGHLTRLAPLCLPSPLRAAGGRLRRLASGAAPQNLREFPARRKADLHP